MIELSFNLGWVPLLATLVLPILTKRGRSGLLMIVPAVLLLVILLLIASPPSIHGIIYSTIETAPWGYFFACIFALALLLGNIFSLNTANTLEQCGALLSAGAAIYASLCDNLFSLFVACELLVIGGAAIVFAAHSKHSYAASFRYLVIHVFSGTLLLIGVAGIVVTTGDDSLRLLDLNNLFAWFIFAGLLINVGAPPLSALIADVYPRASPTGTVYLSMFSTKVAVFILLTLFAGQTLLIPIGLYMVLYGIVYALIENNIRRILSYSIINQVGFMLVGIGLGSTLALYSTATHAFVHILYKALLMMSVGSVVLQTSYQYCTQIGKLYRTMKITTWCGVVGTLAISSFPLTSGFASKPMLEEASLLADSSWLWPILIAASAGVFLHAGIITATFTGIFLDNSKASPTVQITDPPSNMRLAMLITAGLCLLIGIFPGLLYALHPQPFTYTPYTSANVISKLQLLLFSGAAFLAFLPLLKRRRGINLDWDWFYRKFPVYLERCLAPQFGAIVRTQQQFLCAALSAARKLQNSPSMTQCIRSNSHNMVLVAIVLLIVLLFIMFV